MVEINLYILSLADSRESDTTKQTISILCYVQRLRKVQKWGFRSCYGIAHGIVQRVSYEWWRLSRVQWPRTDDMGRNVELTTHRHWLQGQDHHLLMMEKSFRTRIYLYEYKSEFDATVRRRQYRSEPFSLDSNVSIRVSFYLSRISK